MASSTISGPGSGYDTQAIVKALVGAERAPKEAQITAQQKDATVKLSAVGSVKTALEAYQAAITKLNNQSAFNGLAATTSEEKTPRSPWVTARPLANTSLRWRIWRPRPRSPAKSSKVAPRARPTLAMRLRR